MLKRNMAQQFECFSPIRDPKYATQIWQFEYVWTIHYLPRVQRRVRIRLPIRHLCNNELLLFFTRKIYKYIYVYK